MALHLDWLDAIYDPATYPHPISEIQLLETHISWIILTGDWAYKLKKPVNFGFVDFTTLELRRAACDEEVRLNRRTAPAIYDGVVPLAYDTDGPQFGGSGQVIEYSVRMKQFQQEDLLERCLARGELSNSVIDTLAHEVADLHGQAAVASPQTSFGEPALIRENVQACLDVLNETPLTREFRGKLDPLDKWINAEWHRLHDDFVSRKRQGYVRECHGDLHLGNLVLYRGKPTLFDCLEFNPRLRWIDIFSDIAFLVMDLHDRAATPLAWRVLNQWLEQTGDYEGLKVLKYYLAYRALVRAKVAALRLQQPAISASEETHQHDRLASYVDLTVKLIRPERAAIVLMHGVSGSGKSVVASELGSSLPAIRIRSDVERKRLVNLWPPSPQTAESAVDLYSSEMTQKTYQRLQTLARTIVESGYTVIVDAAFLKRADRQAFISLARELDVPCVTVACSAPEGVLVERVSKREIQGRDASDADANILRLQLASVEPLEPDELRTAVLLNTTKHELSSAIRSIQDRIRPNMAITSDK